MAFRAVLEPEAVMVAIVRGQLRDKLPIFFPGYLRGKYFMYSGVVCSAIREGIDDGDIRRESRSRWGRGVVSSSEGRPCADSSRGDDGVYGISVAAIYTDSWNSGLSADSVIGRADNPDGSGGEEFPEVRSSFTSADAF